MADLQTNGHTTAHADTEILTSGVVYDLMKKIRAHGMFLYEYVHFNIHPGIDTGLNAAFIIESETREKLIAEDDSSDDVIFPIVFNEDLSQFEQPKHRKYVIYVPDMSSEFQCSVEEYHGRRWNWFRDRYPAVAAYLKPYEGAAKTRAVRGKDWWEVMNTDRDKEYYQRPKIIIQSTGERLTAAFDTECMFPGDDVIIIPFYDMYVLGVLNSRLANFYVHHLAPELAGTTPDFTPRLVSHLPIPFTREHSLYNRIVNNTEQTVRMFNRYPCNKKLGCPISANNCMRNMYPEGIDRAVYQLYKLSEQEIRLIEYEEHEIVGNG